MSGMAPPSIVRPKIKESPNRITKAGIQQSVLQSLRKVWAIERVVVTQQGKNWNWRFLGNVGSIFKEFSFSYFRPKLSL
jgi:hypothetical protein